MALHNYKAAQKEYQDLQLPTMSGIPTPETLVSWPLK